MIRLAMAGVILGAGLVAAPAAAGPRDPSEQILTEKARKAYKEGTRLYSEGKYVAAIDAFEKAYQLKPNFRVHCSMALCHHKLGQVVEAAQRYKRCLDEGGNKARFRKDIQASLREMEGLITWVEVKSPGKGGTVYLDGTDKGQAPQRIALNPGSHVIEVRRENADPARTTVKAVGGEEKVVTLVPEDRPPQPDALVVKGTDDETAAGGPRSSRRKLPSYWFWTGAGVTLALTTVAIVLGAQTWNLRDDYLDKPSQASYDRFVNRRLLTNVFAFSAAAVAGGTTFLFFYTDFGGKNRERRPSSTDMVSVGVGLQGTF